MERQHPLSPAQPEVVSTDHALLVVWGEYAQEIGLVQGLEVIPIPQQTRYHRPQTKLLELLVATLAGCEYLRDLNEGPHPICQGPGGGPSLGTAHLGALQQRQSNTAGLFGGDDPGRTSCARSSEPAVYRPRGVAGRPG